MSFRLNGLGVLSLVLLWAVASLAAAADLRVAEAAKQGDKEAVRSLLKQHADVNTPLPDGASPLAWAANHDDVEMAGLLIGAGAKVNAANDYGITPLVLACNNGSSAMVDKLLKAGANVNAASDWTGETALMRCAYTGNVEAVKELWTDGADVRAKDIRQGHTALMWALAQKHSEVVRALIEYGADVNAHAFSGFTPLMFAAQQGDMDSAKMLLEAGAKVNEATNGEGLWRGDTALLLASLGGHEALSIYLLDKGADPNAADENGFTALHFALLKGLGKITRVQPHAYTPFLNRPPMVDLVKALFAHGANPNAQVKTEFGGDKFYKAEESPLRPYEPVGTIRPVGATAFMMAAITYDTEMMRLLAASGADPKLTTADNVNALMIAAGLALKRFNSPNPADEKKALEAIKLAVELGVDVNVADSSGETALHGAAAAASDPIIEFLAGKGANLNAKNKDGNTPVDVAYAGYAAAGGAGNSRPGLKWEKTGQLLVKLGAAPYTGPILENRTCGTLCDELHLNDVSPPASRRDR